MADDLFNGTVGFGAAACIFALWVMLKASAKGDWGIFWVGGFMLIAGVAAVLMGLSGLEFKGL